MVGRGRKCSRHNPTVRGGGRLLCSFCAKRWRRAAATTAAAAGPAETAPEAKYNLRVRRGLPAPRPNTYKVRPSLSRSYKSRGERGLSSQLYERHPVAVFAVDVDAVWAALEPDGSLGDLAGSVSGGRYTRVSPQGAQRLAAALNGAETTAAIHRLYPFSKAAGPKHRGNGMLVDACVMGYGGGHVEFRSRSTHVDGCPNAEYASKVSAYTVNLLIQLEGEGRTGVCPFPPDTRAHTDQATEGYEFCATRGVHTCPVGKGIALLTSIAHTPLPQTGRKLVITLFFPPPRGCKSVDHRILNLRAAWADSEENGWRGEGRAETPAYEIPWVVGPGRDESSSDDDD